MDEESSLPPHDLLVECAQGFVRGWTEILVRQYADAKVAEERRRWQKWTCKREWDNVNDPPCHPSDADWQPCNDCEGPKVVSQSGARL